MSIDKTDRAEKKVRVAVRILGDEYTIRGDADPEHIKRLAADIDARVRAAMEFNPKLGRSQAVILAFLNIAEELERLKSQYEELMEFIEEAR
ncbi:MAG: cell division protein ZapA [Firmicutes bacterium]|nr:cell division protein ZapA [Bacillota bacterium]